MKNLFKIWRVLIIIAILGLSCKKEWLEPEPLSFFSPENVYTSKAGFEGQLITMRKNLVTQFTGNRNFISTEYVASDLAVAVFQCDFSKLTPSGSKYFPYLSMFTDIFKFIKDANVVISRIDDIKWDSEEEKNAILAEAYWHRAYWYYRLVNDYGDVPWVGEELKGAKLDFQTYSRWAILKKIQSDLEYAVQWLPVSASPGVPTKWAGDQLLTKVYLANLEFDKAIKTATEIIDGPFSLMTDRFGSYADDPYYNLIWDLHRTENINNAQNTETIFTIVDRSDAPTDARSSGLYTMRLYTPSWWKIQDATGGRGCDWKLAEGDTLGLGNADVRTNWFYNYSLWTTDKHSWKNTPDLRRSGSNWVEMNEIKYNVPSSPNLGESVSLSHYGDLHDTVDTWYPWPLYLTYVPDVNRDHPYGGNGDQYIYRLAGTYLLRAEAYYWKGELALAAADINKVRERAHALPISSGDVTLDYIFDERARELYIEQPRHCELVRASYIMAKLGRDGYSLDNFSKKNYFYDRVMKDNPFYSAPKFFAYGNTANIAPYNVLWPIPQSVIVANTLATINQNVGYQGAENNVPPLTSIK